MLTTLNDEPLDLGDVFDQDLEKAEHVNMLEYLLKDAGIWEFLENEAGTISDTMLNPSGKVFLKTFGGKIKQHFRVTRDKREAMVSLVAQINEVPKPDGIRETEVNAKLPFRGQRFAAMIAPSVEGGPMITIRNRTALKLMPDDLVRTGVASARVMEELKRAIIGRMNMLFIGSTGSGKTETMETMCRLDEIIDERWLVGEDTAELKLDRIEDKALVRTVPKTMRQIIIAFLRHAPDRIIVGEGRDGPAMVEMFNSMNTGHKGMMGSMHANGPTDAIERIITLFAQVMPDARSQIPMIVNSLDRIVWCRRVGGKFLIDGVHEPRMVGTGNFEVTCISN